jgi:hypothetical protein
LKETLRSHPSVSLIRLEAFGTHKSCRFRGPFLDQLAPVDSSRRGKRYPRARLFFTDAARHTATMQRVFDRSVGSRQTRSSARRWSTTTSHLERDHGCASDLLRMIVYRISTDVQFHSNIQMIYIETMPTEQPPTPTPSRVRHRASGHGRPPPTSCREVYILVSSKYNGRTGGAARTVYTGTSGWG